MTQGVCRASSLLSCCLEIGRTQLFCVEIPVQRNYETLTLRIQAPEWKFLTMHSWPLSASVLRPCLRLMLFLGVSLVAKAFIGNLRRNSSSMLVVVEASCHTEG